MKLKCYLIVIAMMAFSHISSGQDWKEISGKRKEIYFSFQIKSPAEIRDLTRVISIDDVRGDTVFAYANAREFLRFSQRGCSITLLPHPGEGPEWR
jgi:hypothetical protein